LITIPTTTIWRKGKGSSGQGIVNRMMAAAISTLAAGKQHLTGQQAVRPRVVSILLGRDIVYWGLMNIGPYTMFFQKDYRP